MMFVVEFLSTPIEELKDKIHTALLYTSLEAVRDYLSIATSAHKAITDDKELRQVYNGVDWTLANKTKA